MVFLDSRSEKSLNQGGGGGGSDLGPSEIWKLRNDWVINVLDYTEFDAVSRTAWEYLYDSKDDRAFILTIGDVVGNARPRVCHQSLTSAGTLGLILHHLNSTMANYSLHQIFGITTAVCSRYRNWALSILQAVLRKFYQAQVTWPTKQQCHDYSSCIQHRHPLLEHAIGFIDGCHLPITTAANNDLQNAYNNGWCSAHFTSNIFVFAPDGMIIHATINTPGSWHDIAKYWVIGDTAFPTSKDLVGQIITPPKSNSNSYPGDTAACYRFIKFNEQLWGMRCLQGSFGRLKLPMPAQDMGYRYQLLEVCTRLHNLRTRLEVYEGSWQGNGIYTEFKELLFSDIKKNDRIHHYYTFVP
ncbi:hypothetical protein L873DRAFT_1830927 [Choiromyces venosus 120613-1]|uniref:DDE Tnp4 domain-containing protein n=1 Tax=Choiromyces venosus 120613-1 TaxID=1336337 RepID=A0A3N4J3Y8_9PEZI|nr:hypothetical protein L873DRAFT_1830927 [Choiromyces venosus 120613-1]